MKYLKIDRTKCSSIFMLSPVRGLFTLICRVFLWFRKSYQLDNRHDYIICTHSTLGIVVSHGCIW
ncbi:Uncharacterised protein [Legionella pneumophila]|nr:Uncharacterised protein [Legionella pneumophila]CZH10508.1 Uncharacterised protein [Legionella pneumophila]CZH11605.1 Uncharacterised protein [Legionella pneumophila]CZH43430.1 Uncharacterised protein [Legionella pneumophila]CZI59885.1 Uncharacterised protein [Legionella pneumophila]